MTIKDQLIAIMNEECDIDTEIDQTLYKKPSWAVGQIVRASGLVEDIGPSGIGHPNRGWLKLHDPTGELGFGIHACNGECCGEQ